MSTCNTRVCVVVENHHEAVMGGAQYQAGLIAAGLAARRDFEVFYLARRCPIGSSNHAYSIIKIGTDVGIRRRAVFFDAPQLWRVLRDINPDVVYQRMRQSYTGVVARYAIKYNKKFIFHVAGELDIGIGFFRTKRISLNTPFDIVERAVGLYGLMRASEVIVQTPHQAELLYRKYNRRAIAVIPNFHPSPDINDTISKQNNVTLVSWIGNFKPIKRPELFVRLAAEFRHDSSLKFVMAGRPGNAQKYAKLHEQIESLPNLDYKGELSLEMVNDTLAESHIFVNTSVSEGFPNTFVQAWMRRAIIVSVVADVEGGIDHLGLGFRTLNYEGLRSRLSQLSGTVHKYRQMLDHAQDFALKNCSTSNIDKIAEILQKPN